MRKLFYFALTIFFILLWFRLVDVPWAIALVKRARWGLILGAVLVGFIYSFLAIFRLKTLLSVFGKIEFWPLWLMSHVSSLISLIFPFSIGGFAFAYLISKKMKISYARALSVLFFDFFINVGWSLFLASIAVFYFAAKKLVVVKSETAAYFLILALFGFGGVLSLWFLRRSQWVRGLFEKVKDALLLFTKSKLILVQVAALLFLTGLVGVAQSYLYFFAFGMWPPLIDFILAGSLLGVLNLIPGAPTKIGQYETFGVLTLPYLLNLDKNQVFAALLTSHLLSISLTIIIGGAAFYLLGLDLKSGDFGKFN